MLEYINIKNFKSIDDLSIDLGRFNVFIEENGCGKSNTTLGEVEFMISDKYLEDGLKSFEIRNANEGFPFLLFYITLFTSDYTPSFFAIDNIDTALNPKLISVLADLSVKYNKQVILTTHNPSVSDGLNLNNDNERLFVISRNAIGYTRANRITKKPSIEGEPSLKLSEQFLRGYIGGLPKNSLKTD